MLSFVKWVDAKGEFRWTLWAENTRKIACSGEGYKNLSDLEAMIYRIQSEAKSANILDHSKK